MLRYNLIDYALDLNLVIAGDAESVETQFREIYGHSLHKVPQGYLLGVLNRLSRMQFVKITLA